ncbi:hypothetical protein NPIL_322551, partial [Nephila pilipes]
LLERKMIFNLCYREVKTTYNEKLTPKGTMWMKVKDPLKLSIVSAYRDIGKEDYWSKSDSRI